MDDNDRSLINYFNDMRNWSFHIPVSLLNSYLEAAKEKYPNSTTSGLKEEAKEILVPKFVYREGEFLVSLLEEKRIILTKVNQAFLLIKQDLEKLVGAKVRVAPLNIEDPQFMEDVAPSVTSWNLQHRGH